MNKKPIIGIMPTSNYMESEDSFFDTYRYANNYVKKIVENGGIPYFIPLCDNKVIDYSLIEICDGLLLPGGSKVQAYSLEIIDYFYKKDKPILGICLGVQTLGLYSVTGVGLEKEDDIIVKIDDKNSHFPVNLVRDNEEILIHKNIIKKDSKLYEIFCQDEIMVNSLHKYKINKVGPNFEVTMKSIDDIIEGIEAKDKKFVVGVQFHPEVLPQYNLIFERFINECRA